METIITAATIMAMYLNAAGNVNSQYCYNADMENGKVTAMYVYEKRGEALSGKAEYRYTYDALGRVLSKEVLRMSAATGRLEPESRFAYSYTGGAYAVEYSRWDSRRHCFAPAESRTCYAPAGEGVMSVATYTLGEDGSATALVDNVLALVPAGDGMFAGF